MTGRGAGTVDEWKWLTDSIPTGRRDAISMGHLARVHNLSGRKMRLAIERARRAGILICSCDNGYFMPETLEEIQEHARRMGERIKTGRACLVPFLREIRRAGVR